MNKKPKRRNIVAKNAHQFNKYKRQPSKIDKLRHKKIKHKGKHED